MACQLLHEQRIALGARDAAPDRLLLGTAGQQDPGQLLRIGVAQRVQFDDRGRRVSRLDQPRGIDRVALVPGRQQQHDRRAARQRLGHAGKRAQGAPIGPVDVLDHQQQRHSCRPVAGECHEGLALPAAPLVDRRRSHEQMPFAGERQAGEARQKRVDQRGLARCRRVGQQRAGEDGQRVASLGRAEVEYQRGVGATACAGARRSSSRTSRVLPTPHRPAAPRGSPRPSRRAGRAGR